MPQVKLSRICKYICQDIDLEIADGELMVLLGPNGAGKTTVLNVIAGLCDYTGSVLFNALPVDFIPTSQRRVGYLFQDLFLFPHLNVASNIAYGLISLKQTPSAVEERVNELLKLMNIVHLARRFPLSLSGGERQRVALARALAPSPQVLLLDEPFTSVDRQTAKYLRTEIKQLQRQLGITTIYVTHDLTEAEEMADRVALINRGKIEQVAALQQVFFFPSNEIVSDFIGQPNILECNECTALGNGVVEAKCGEMRVVVPHLDHQIHRISIFPGDIYVSKTSPPGPDINRFKGNIIGITRFFDVARLRIGVGSNILTAEVPVLLFDEMGLDVGHEVFIILKLRRIRAYHGS